MGRIKNLRPLTNLKNALHDVRFRGLECKFLRVRVNVGSLEFSSVKSKRHSVVNVGVSSWFSEIRQASFDINPDGRIVWVEIEGVPLKLWTLNTFKRIVTRSIFREKSVVDSLLKEVPGWTPDLVEDSDEEELSDDDSLEEGMKNLESENDCSNSFEVPDTVFENEGGSKKDSSDRSLLRVWAYELWSGSLPILSPFGFISRVNDSSLQLGSLLPLLLTLMEWRNLVGFRIEISLKLTSRFGLKITKVKQFLLLQIFKKELNCSMRVIDKVQDRFAKPVERRANIDMRFPKTIFEDQSQDLEREVSKQEIKTAVWGCGTDKSPGPDGFSFGFYRHFWPVIEHDVYMAVNHFFIHGEIPPGCNSSFIALIPKVPDANLVKDFRPISLIGSIYKIIWPRFLSTALCKWRSKGSILVNGCPTNEFQFYKRLKQGDPLSPFLFILVMESLHLSFQRIVNAGMFKGIVLDQSLCLSHMFYADDAIFLGEWSDGNISTLIHVLKCFFHASGLKINLNKSKIMGINVESAQVNQRAAKLEV
ncbi:RNA-directed DNA polymerase, eukaryota [Tanacetum coccineum]